MPASFSPIFNNASTQAAAISDLFKVVLVICGVILVNVSSMIVVLVSDAASYVTGRTIFVDGGMTDYPDFAHGG